MVNSSFNPYDWDQCRLLLEWPQASLVDLTANSGATANLKFSDFQVESTGILGLRQDLLEIIFISRTSLDIDKKLDLELKTMGQATTDSEATRHSYSYAKGRQALY